MLCIGDCVRVYSQYPIESLGNYSNYLLYRVFRSNYFALMGYPTQPISIYYLAFASIRLTAHQCATYRLLCLTVII